MYNFIYNNPFILVYNGFPILVLNENLYNDLKNYYKINKWNLLFLLNKNKFKYNLFIEEKILILYDNIIFKKGICKDALYLEQYKIFKNYSSIQKSFFFFFLYY